MESYNVFDASEIPAFTTKPRGVLGVVLSTAAGFPIGREASGTNRDRFSVSVKLLEFDT